MHFSELKLPPRWGLTFTIDYFYQSGGRTGLILKMLKYINKIIAYEILMQFFKSFYQDIFAPSE